MINESKFEKLSFWQLLNEVYIEIPIIQRDYAHGRKNEQKVRVNFLNALYNAFYCEPVELDFIYGSRESDKLQPLDGQQRLTTLFLLHWYISVKENKIDTAVKERLGRFCYETRTSSREFCNDLVTNPIDFDMLLSSDIDENGKNKMNELSKSIRNASWFLASWEKDPTIFAMLTMLDAIHERFKETSNLWFRLIDEHNPMITFLYIDLKNFGLSDDLYIKMNARGMQLTHFENFKSQFEKYIEINILEDPNIIPQEKFSHKIDTVWTDLFWEYKVEQKNEKYHIDSKLINFIAGIAINFYAENKEISSKEKTESSVTSNKDKKDGIENRINYIAWNQNEVSPGDFSTNDAFTYLISCFDKYSEKDNDNKFIYSVLKPNLDMWNYCKKTLFEDFIDFSEPSYKPRVLFYSQTIYLLNNDYDETHFSDWMRVARNIVHNSTIDSPGTFISAINLIKELSHGCLDIYDYLSYNNVKSEHARKQVSEEIEKAKIILLNRKNKEIIQQMEDTDFFKGKIDFALYCFDHNFDIIKFKSLYEVIKTFKSEDKIPDDFKRAFLTIKSNDYYEVWGSWSWSLSCHKRFLCDTYSDLKNYFADGELLYHVYLKELILKRLENNFTEICKNYIIPREMPDWKKKLIKGEKLIDGATFILIPDSNKFCYLAKQQRPSNLKQVTTIQ